MWHFTKYHLSETFVSGNNNITSFLFQEQNQHPLILSKTLNVHNFNHHKMKKYPRGGKY